MLCVDRSQDTTIGSRVVMPSANAQVEKFENGEIEYFLEH